MARRVLPILILLALYWPGVTTWFYQDDFGWLNLRHDVHSAGDLGAALFAPKAHGNMRPLGENAYWLGLASVFGPDPLPFHLAAFSHAGCQPSLAGRHRWPPDKSAPGSVHRAAPLDRQYRPRPRARLELHLQSDPERLLFPACVLLPPPPPLVCAVARLPARPRMPSKSTSSIPPSRQSMRSSTHAHCSSESRPCSPSPHSPSSFISISRRPPPRESTRRASMPA